ncbi:BQ5605_C002g01409 [Microbotryum silenes-dioicae]|uniref:BQ5605_C002g01409 protein n=1 Tax=Microbotryum silenes-dioicae TaxID=796604 RepID=A0A2X0P1Q7_9BASI|nr:BQ5605_C002g01409 [Microbotryum silenes-dioicae]
MRRQRITRNNGTMDTTASTSSGPAISQVGEATPLVAKNSRLLSYDELEDWRKDNHYIRTGYRQTLKSYYACFASIFGVHNETTNIASSLLYLVMAITPHERSQHRQGWLAPLAGIPYPFPSAAQPSVTWIDSFGKSDLDEQLNPREDGGMR